jgi:hypothetical protein
VVGAKRKFFAADLCSFFLPSLAGPLELDMMVFQDKKNLDYLARYSGCKYL